MRGTVDEFRQEVNMYMYWKLGMDIYVSHVRRKQLPSYVYPEGYKRPQRQLNQQSEKMYEEAEGDSCGSANKGLKRRIDSESGNLTPSRLEKRASVSPQQCENFLWRLLLDFVVHRLCDMGISKARLFVGKRMLSHSQERTHLVGEEVIASLNICNRIKDACLVGHNDENTAKFASSTFENFETQFFQRAGNLIECALQNDVDEVMDLRGKQGRVKKRVYF